jgi:hypothetical protein
MHNWDWIGIATVVAAAGAAVASIIGAISSLVNSWRLRRVSDVVDDVKHNTDGLTDKLGRASHAAGVVEGTTAERERTNGLKAAYDEGKAKSE